MISFNINQQSGIVIISYKFDDMFTPADIKNISPPDAVKENFAHKGVILAGRGPVWLYCFLTHYYHPTKFVATYDPRLQGAVVVESHGREYKPGDVIPVSNNLIPV
jgi:CRISPR-associated protein Csx3